MRQDASSYKETKLAYQRYVERFGPDDFFSIRKNLEEQLDNMAMKDLMSYFRFSGYDAQLFKLSVSSLFKRLPYCSVSEKEDLLKIINLVWERYYPIGEPQDLAFDLGMLLFQMEFYPDAILFFERSLEEYGEEAPIYYNIALCYDMLMNQPKTLEFLDHCIRLDPTHAEAQSFRLEIQDNNRR